MARKVIANNKKALFDFHILERLEAGIALSGSEVKAIRAGRVNLKDSFVKIIKGEAFLLNAHISYLETTNPHYKPDERRPRKLLLHRKQIDKLTGSVSTEGMTLVTLSIYFNERNRAKAEIALAKGKNLHDKRETLKKRILDREVKAALKEH
ncbi:SsrA-binding protein SmpB [Wolinella succinogenes]|uniref:SsrA-binding protein n=1 Tax=Wolinella succinogenes (strain ATCC 29543 / DSM 1740 / CCUG 13145 / JCM 31913 / LMG 7466 / NCTC 11488 / FDC 602W) TaxID=273121 RepID=SSRP_WOLSU|nr:SsrA-binding protein SmpB [Wolinella succinogenes]Q7M9J0.1 RecName: Full=SsrA-binding protein; AltName: Full=Small protein B [Wolinella succinogenes DSM 1740]HCZ19479.1 SsrA-binding protein [Helicobacter sp.]NLU35229.1 SsrA-binding protein SmpB [Wolinella succinogenes]CAE09989.1 SMALL PROTEIN B HOMOLOG [Wolinella succinogenes]VEG82201.1 SsrA-binding protein [Wolinella succinogenes]